MPFATLQFLIESNQQTGLRNLRPPGRVPDERNGNEDHTSSPQELGMKHHACDQQG